MLINLYRVLTPSGVIDRQRNQKCGYVTQLLDYPRPGCYLERILHQQYSAAFILNSQGGGRIESNLRSVIQSFQYLIYDILIEIIIDQIKVYGTRLWILCKIYTC